VSRPLARWVLASTLLAGAAAPAPASEAASAASAAAASSRGTPWDLTLGAGRSASTTLTLRNRCLTPQRFEATKTDEMPWFRWTGDTAADLAPASDAALPVEIDARALLPGLYEGVVEVRCRDCARDLACSQDHERFLVRLRVPWDEATLSRLRAEELVAGELLAVVELPADRRAERAALERLRRSAGADRAREASLPGIGYRLVLLALPRGAPLAPALLALQQVPEVLWAQPNVIYRTLGERAADGGADPLAELQYAPRLLRATEMSLPAPTERARVLIVDSAVDAGHPDLAGARLRQVSLLPARATAPHAHGTAMVGILAARVRNGVGIAGLVPDAEVLLAAACGPRQPAAADATCTTETVARGLDLALTERARVVSVSLGGARDPLVARLCAELARRDVLVVAAAGNGGPRGEPSHPAALAEVVAVAAVDGRTTLYAESTRGDYVDLAAPGVEVLSTAPGGRYLPITGTSAAAAHVAALAAMALQVQPRLRAAELARLLGETARDVGPPGRDGEVGAGLADAAALLARLREPAPR
jgi:hypothetical protein